MLTRRNLLFLSVLLPAVGFVYADSTSSALRKFNFRLHGSHAERVGDHWVLTASPESSPMIYLEFNIQLGHNKSRGNTFPVIARKLVGGNFDFIKHDATSNDELWHFESGQSVRLFWSCEPINETTTKVHAIAVEYRHGRQVCSLCQSITLTLSAKSA